jgi:hypothetical protein
VPSARVKTQKDANDLGAAAKFGVDTLDGIRRGDRTPVVNREIEVGEHIGLYSAQPGGHAREPGLEHSQHVGSR